MRWVVALLVVANLAFFAWQYQEHERAAARREAPEELAYVSRLLLLSEAPPPSPPAVAAAPEPAPAIPEAPAAASAPAEAGVAEAPRAEATAAKVPPAEGLPAKAQVAEAAAARGPVVEPSAAEPTSHEDRLVQVPLAEPPVAQALPPPATSLEKPAPGAEPRPSAEGTAPPEPPPVAAATAPPAPSAVAPPAPTVAPAVPTPPRRCYTVGPLAEEGPAAAVRDWLTQRGASTELRWATRQEPRSFWVYLPPAGSAEEARELAARLAQAGVTDVMRLPAGPQANAISLGLYIRRPAAEKRQAEVKRLGFDAQIEARTRDVREAWVSATYAPGAELPLAALRGAFPDSKVVARDCP